MSAPPMTPEHFARVRELFHRGCELGPGQRGAFLDETCHGDARLRAAVADLLVADESPSLAGALEAGAIAERLTPGSAPADAGPPAQVGAYRVIRELGAGGMGVVYLARQGNPERDVALKLLRAHAPSADLKARFAREVRVLGRLVHPGIARVYEAGSARTPGGVVSYFAMEYIDGTRITSFADEHGLDVAARLELVARVADAVQHAHSRGVIHRDLKPSNILIRAGGTEAHPVVLDFGVALILDPEVQQTVLTETGLLIGTIGYMSPEQLAGDHDGVDARADVYALGAILYELLAGAPAYDLRGKALAEAARIVRDEEPAPLRAQARGRGACARLGAGLDRDVETIVAKAMAKDREQRYASAAALAEDLRRRLAREPILARPATVRYQLAMFARRHRALVAGAGVGVALLIAGLAVSTSLYVLSERNRALAVSESEASASVQDYMIESLLKAAAPEQLGQGATIVQVLLHARGSVHERFAGQPEVEVRVHTALADVLGAVGEIDASDEEWARARALLEAQDGPDGAQTVAAMIQRSASLTGGQRHVAGAELASEALERARRAHRDDRDLMIQALMLVGRGLENKAHFGEALVHYREALAIAETSPARSERIIVSLMCSILTCEHGRRGRDAGLVLDLLAQVYERAVALPADDPDRAMTLSSVMLIELKVGHVDRALALAAALPGMAEAALVPARRGFIYRRVARVYEAVSMYEDAERFALGAHDAFALLFKHFNQQNETCARQLFGLYGQWPGHERERVEWGVQAAKYRLMIAGTNERPDAAHDRSVVGAVATLREALEAAGEPATNADALGVIWSRRDELAPRGHGRRAAFFANFAIACVNLGVAGNVEEAIEAAVEALPDAASPTSSTARIARAQSRQPITRPDGSVDGAPDTPIDP